MTMTWKALEPILHGSDGYRASPAVVDAVRRVAQAGNRTERTAALDGLVAVIGRRPDDSLLRRLATSDESFAHRIALELAARLSAVSPDAIADLHPLLRQRKLPAPLKLDAGVALLQAASGDNGLASATLRSFLVGQGKSRARERLQLVRKRIRGHADLEALCDRWLDQMTMACPACEVRLPRPELVKHLWDVHRLTLEGDQAVEPWRAVETAIADYTRAGDPAALDRACEVARQLDPEAGLERVHRLLLRQGVSDAEAAAHLVTLAGQRGQAVCPGCFAGVAVSVDAPARPATVAPGRLAAENYEVDITGGGLLTRLTIRTPTGTLYRGTEPGQRFDRVGLQWLLVMPLVAIAFILAVTLSGNTTTLLAVLAVLALAVAIDVRVRLLMWASARPADRVVDHAWRMLVPHLLSDTPPPQAAGFLASLAAASPSRGSATLREPRLTLALSRGRAGQGVTPAGLAALAWLEASDAPARGRDAVIVLADHAAAGLTGEVPLSVTELLLANERLRDWPTASRSRLRVLLAGHAFAASLGVWDLQELGRAVPSLGAVLGTENPDDLGRLLLLYSLRQVKPWVKCGTAFMAFELARYPALGGPHLRDRPDMLLCQLTSEGGLDEGPPSPILVCGGGIVFRGAVLSRADEPIEVTPRTLLHGGGFEMRVGTEKLAFRSDPTDLADRLERWAKYLFNEFMPKVDALLAVRNPALLRKLLDQRTVTCPECGRRVTGRPGVLGVSRAKA